MNGTRRHHCDACGRDLGNRVAETPAGNAGHICYWCEQRQATLRQEVVRQMATISSAPADLTQSARVAS